MGAWELRNESKGFGMVGGRAITDELDVEMLVELIGVRLQAENLVGVQATMNWTFSDIDEQHIVGIDNCTVHHRAGRVASAPDATITATKAHIAAVLRGELSADDFVNADGVSVDNDVPVRQLLGSLDSFTGVFGIVEP